MSVATATVEQLVQQLQRLPAHRMSATRVLHLVDDPTASAEDLGKVISTDPSMTARLLKMANSASVGLSTPVGTVAGAVTVLGFSVVRSVAVSWAAGLFEGGPRSLPEGYWEHSITVASAAVRIGSALGVPGGKAYSAGLLHDLGQPLLLRFDSGRYRRMLRTIERPDSAEQCEIERRTYGQDHAIVGALVLRSWGLPDELVDAVANHHHAMTPDDPPLRRAVALAESTAQLLRDDGAVDPRAREQLEADLGRAGVDVPVEELLLTTRADVTATAGLL
ncbi:MAG: HDOD domain-containing protein [Actinomycetota bacterium]